MPRVVVDPKLWVVAAHFTVFACAASPAAVLMCGVSPARAQSQTTGTPPAAATPAPATPAAEPTPAAREAARVAYTRGQTAFAQGQYEAARIAFEEAFAAVPNPIVLLSVSESHAKLGHVRDAANALRRYLELRPDAPDRADIEAKIQGLENTPAFVAVTSVPTGAVLTVDDNPVTQTAPAQLELTPGKHTLKYALPGYTTSTELLQVDPGARYELEIKLQPEAPAPVVAAAPAAAVAAQTEAPAPISPAVLWITAGIGAAGIITGSVLGVMAMQEKSDFDSNPTEESADRGERLALFADVGFGIGIMALATTAVLLFTHDEPAAAPAASDEAAPTSHAKPHAARAQLELVPQLSPTTAAATARVRF